MGEVILSHSTVEALRDCVLIAADRHRFGLAEALRDAGFLKEPTEADPDRVRSTFEGCLETINWNDRESILPVIPIFEDAYAESPKDFTSVHRRVDATLAKDGFRIKEGRLIRLPF